MYAIFSTFPKKIATNFAFTLQNYASETPILKLDQIRSCKHFLFSQIWMQMHGSYSLLWAFCLQSCFCVNMTVYIILLV